MPKIHSSPPHLNGHIFAAIDVETTGTVAGFHEIIQIAVVPLTSRFEVNKDIPPFYYHVAPEHKYRADPEAMAVNKLDLDHLEQTAPSQERVADLFTEWFKKLDLPFDRRLVGLAFNWPTEHGFTGAWLGPKQRDRFFHFHYRDAMSLMAGLNDKAWHRGLPVPFPKLGLRDLCAKLDVPYAGNHNAMEDAICAAEGYRRLLDIDLL
jgi:DNA polymerase III epsilon subunit-like protein